MDTKNVMRVLERDSPLRYVSDAIETSYCVVRIA